MKLTIIIPTRDRPHFLKRAVTSALHALPRKAGNVLVVNDGDLNTARDALKYIHDSRLKLVDNLGAKGPAGARNFGMNYSDSELYLFLDDDDELLSDYPFRIIAAYENTPAEYGFCKYIEAYISDRERDNQREVLRGKPYREGMLPDCKNFKDMIAGFGMGFWISKEAYDLAGPLNEILLTSEDVEYQIRLIRNGTAGWYHEDPGVKVNRHAGSVLSDRSNQTKIIGFEQKSKDLASILETHREFLRHKVRIHTYLIRRYLKNARKSGNYYGCLKYLRRYISDLLS